MQYVKEIFDVVAGNVHWVDSNASSVAPDGSFTHPLLTVQAGVDKATASNGDMILVKSGHSEAITAQIDFDKAGVNVRGLGHGNKRPTLNPNGTIDCIDVSAANCTLENFHFAAPGTTGQTADVNVDAAGFTLRNCSSLGSATGTAKTAYITITANGDDCLIDGFDGKNTVVDMVDAIDVAAANRVEIANCHITGTAAIEAGTSGVISDSGNAVDLLIHHCSILTSGTAGEAITLGASIGLVWDCRYASGHNTIAEVATIGSAMDSYQSYASVNVSQNAAIAPIVDTE